MISAVNTWPHTKDTADARAREAEMPAVLSVVRYRRLSQPSAQPAEGLRSTDGSAVADHLMPQCT